MGLFDSLTGNKAEIKDEKEAFMAIIFASIAIDGEISPEEITSVINLFQTKQMFAGADIAGMFKKVSKIHQAVGGSLKLIELATPKITENLKAMVFANAIDLVMADGIAHEQEKKLLETLQQQLAISNDIASKILEVIAIKNKG